MTNDPSELRSIVRQLIATFELPCAMFNEHMCNCDTHRAARHAVKDARAALGEQ